jgi:multiple sugar transport system substrate-binding protein
VSALLLAAVLTGCKQGKGSGSAPAGRAAANAPYELSVAWWGGEARHKKTLEMIDKYMARYPNVKVVSQYAALPDYSTKISTQAAGGNLPDVYLVQLNHLSGYASKGLMRPLQDLIDAGKIDVSNYTKGALSGSSYNGNIVGITFGDTTTGVVYNKTMLDKIGYPVPTDLMKYSELSAYLKGLVPKMEKGSYAFILNNNEMGIQNFVRQYGCYGVISADGKQPGYTKEILAKFINFHYDLFKVGVMGSMEVILDDRGKFLGDSLFGKGKMAMYFININQGKIFQASIDDELGMVRFPLVDDYTNQYSEVAVCSTWAISGKTQKVDESAQFINYMVNDWEVQEIYDMDIGVPGSTVIQQKLIDKLNLSNKVDVMKKREIELMQGILNTIEPFNGVPPGYSAMTGNLWKNMDEVFYGRMTVQQAVDAHFDAAKTLLQ